MSRIIAVAAFVVALAILQTPAFAQSIIGNWIDQEGETIEIVSRNGRYHGNLVSGPNAGRRVLQLVANGDGTFSGKKIRLESNSRTSDVQAQLSEGGARLDLVCAFTRRPRNGCNESWRRPIMRYRELPPNVRDEIRKPKPPPVIYRHPDIRIQRAPG